MIRATIQPLLDEATVVQSARGDGSLLVLHRGLGAVIPARDQAHARRAMAALDRLFGAATLERHTHDDEGQDDAGGRPGRRGGDP